MEARVSLGRAWPHWRAALVTLHCLAVALVAMPAPSGSSRLISVDDPRFASEVHPWARLLGVSDESFARRAATVRTEWVETRGRLVAPFERYLSAVGAQQPWHMFSTPNRAPVRFVLEERSLALADQEGEWEFLSGLPPGNWRRSFFESERTRSVLNTIGRDEAIPLADDFCVYIAKQALRDHPRSAQVRCRLVAVPSPSWRARAPAIGAPEVRYHRVVDR